MNTKRQVLLAAAALVALAGPVQASLVDNGNGTVTDTTSNLIWLQNWNVNGGQTWATQKAWAENLSFAGSSNWMLPSIGEFEALFAEHGDLTKVAEFTNVQWTEYWSGTEIEPGLRAWGFFPRTGGKFNDNELYPFGYAVAVRAVPEPGSFALMALGLGGICLFARRYRGG